MSLVAAFSEPAYERLRFMEHGRNMQFLAFVRPVSAELRQFLTKIGAAPSQRYEAACYPEVWELSPEWIAKPPLPMAELDLCIAIGLRILDGRYPHTAGYWSQCQDGDTHWTSHLLSSEKTERARRSR